MRRLTLLAGLLLWARALSPAQQVNAPPILGFSAANSQIEQQWEDKFRAAPSPDNLREYIQLLSAHPHHVGSPYNKQDEDWILAHFKQWGWDAHVETYQVLFPTPKERQVEMVEPTRFAAKLQEPPLAGDPTVIAPGEELPPYNAYSADGDVTAPLVYVNYGLPQDYDELEQEGISVKGAIVIARYGAAWRGIKPKVAAQHGAVGCLIYSDPRDDGFAQGDVFPQGPWRPSEGVQRGSVMDFPLYPGDPLTPGVAATSNAKRLDLKDARVLTTIPVLPLSYADAQPLLAAIGGPIAPPNWRGALSLTYHIGPGPAKVHLRVESNWDLKPVNDIIAKLPGTTEAGEWVMRGNHYDAWVDGAEDPVSGIASEMEEARALGEMYKAGWKPKRTIIYCAWDGEEPGLVGSTEWVEDHAQELQEHAVAYINSDANGRGYLTAGGSQSLGEFINQVARVVIDPEKGMPVWQRNQLRRIAEAPSPEQRDKLRNMSAWPIDALGSGSDYSPFLDFAGVASLYLTYGGDTGEGVYHSAYDDFYWYSHFGDPTFAYERLLSQTAGTAVMRLADADLLPFDFAGLCTSLHGYVAEIKELATKQDSEIRERNREIAEGLFKATSDAKNPPAVEAVPPQLDFAPLDAALDALNRSADRYQRAVTHVAQGNGAALGRASIQRVNEELLRAERALTDPRGLPDRPWYKNQIYAPGFYTGYGVKTIPAVREAIEQKQWDVARQAIGNVATVLGNETSVIDRASEALERATK